MKPKTLVAFGLCVCFLGCAAKKEPSPNVAEPASVAEEEIPPTEIPLIVMDEQGLVAAKRMSVTDYRGNMEAILPSAQRGVLSSVKEATPANPWALRTVVVGVGLKLGFGGSVIGIGANGGIRMAFSNSTKPSIP
jgi:hypothetical protein